MHDQPFDLDTEFEPITELVTLQAWMHQNLGYKAMGESGNAFFKCTYSLQQSQIMSNE